MIRGPSPANLDAARAELKAAGVAEAIHQAVDTWPPIPDEVLAELAQLLAPTDKEIDEAIDKWPPLTPEQKARVMVLVDADDDVAKSETTP
jgi:hypothetical protein